MYSYVCICLPLLLVLAVTYECTVELPESRYEFDFKDNEIENQFELDLACPRLAICYTIILYYCLANTFTITMHPLPCVFVYLWIMHYVPLGSIDATSQLAVPQKYLEYVASAEGF